MAPDRLIVIAMRGKDIRAARDARKWSVSRTIQALNVAADRHGIRLMTPASLRVAISRWENGHDHPDAVHSRLLSEVFELPNTSEIFDRGRHYPARADVAVDVLDAVAASDLGDDRCTRGTDPADRAVASQAVTGYLFAHSRLLAESPLVVLHTAEIAERIRETAAATMSADFRHGGGHVRRSLLTFFREQVTPHLRAPHPERIRREIFSAAAEVIQMLGWSAYDAGRHAVAVRYFIQGLKLADEGADHLMGARLLANLSHQANFLGQYADAVMYARAAQSALKGHGTKTVETMCVMMEARGLASLGDRHSTAALINRAQRLLERSAGAEPAWISYYDPAELAGDASHCFRDLGIAAQAQAFAIDAIIPATPTRTRAFMQVVAADAARINGDLEHAAVLATLGLTDGVGLQSARYVQYLAGFCSGVPSQAFGHPAFAELVNGLRDEYPQIVLPRTA